MFWQFGIVYDYLEYVLAICYGFWPFGIFYGHLEYDLAMLVIF
jgi:hypothetical protein